MQAQTRCVVRSAAVQQQLDCGAFKSAQFAIDTELVSDFRLDGRVSVSFIIVSEMSAAFRYALLHSEVTA